jgi:hypothetical protein
MKFFATPYRISGIAGLLFVTLSFIASGLNVQPPTYLEDGTALVTWFAENGTWFRAGHVLAALAFLPFYFPFFAGFCERLREAEGAPAIWSRVAWAGAIMSPAAGVTAGAFSVGPALLAGGISSDAAVFAAAAHFYAFPVVSGSMNRIIMIGATVVILRTGVFSRWLGWSGAVIGGAALGGSVALVDGDPDGLFATISAFSWLAYFLWIAAVSVGLVRDRFGPTGGVAEPERSIGAGEALPTMG